MAAHAWVATRKGLFELCRAARGWRVGRVAFLGDPVTAVLPPDPASGRPMIAALNLGHFGVKCHASDDRGETWREIDAPAYPAQPQDADDDVAWKLVQVWTLAAIDGAIWAGTLPGGLFRSDDAARWTLNAALWQLPARRRWFGGGYDVPGIHSVLGVQGADGGSPTILVGISCGGVWASDDGGASWSSRTRGMRASYMPAELADDEAAQDPHPIAACAADTRMLWCQHHDGIWRSGDAGLNWQRLEPTVGSGFGFAVAADPRHPRRAWFVPAESDMRRVPADGALAVLRTDDGGRTFERLGDGLPQSRCYDLVYRHGLAVDDEGRALVLGSTSGGLWTSDDAGEHWRIVDARLPPIHAVAFGGG